jgi:hypothetical protein
MKPTIEELRESLKLLFLSAEHSIEGNGEFMNLMAALTELEQLREMGRWRKYPEEKPETEEVMVWWTLSCVKEWIQIDTKELVDGNIWLPLPPEPTK